MVIDERYVEGLWRRFLEEPAAIAPDWRNAFQFISLVYGEQPFSPARTRVAEVQPHDLRDYLTRFGHLHAALDPLGLTPIPPLPTGLRGGDEDAELVRAYTGSLTVETGHVDDPLMRDWIVTAFEDAQREGGGPDPAVLDQLLDTEALDRFLARKLPGKKRFGSEGADAILPLLHAIRREAQSGGVDELVIGSMHRGRLSVLKNFAGMDAARMFGLVRGEHNFPDRPDLPGDLAYHLGQRSEAAGMRCTLLPNPSHLEAVNPAVIGFTRARRSEGSGRAMAVIVHTDASVVGQGVNAELLQMSALPGFQVGGAIHIVINNQIGFTTEPSEARSSRYCTGPWRAVDSLLLHVNGDDVDAVVRAAALALRFRERFGRDVVIDLVCYRANGHNEIDEPRFTQPLYYHAADQKIGVADTYARRLIDGGLLSEQEVRARRLRADAKLEADVAAAPGASDEARAVSNRVPGKDPQTSDLRDIVVALSRAPANESNAKLAKLMERRLDELENGIGWPLAEAMAFAWVLRSGVSVRFAGQDVERGAFSQRHFAIVHPHTGLRRRLLDGFAQHGAQLEVVNTLLSEYAALGFEYGYSLGTDRALCVWEAQFGDFANGAQIVIDQFVASGFEKWRQASALVLLLPHGLEGQGPEHSSARIERLLQLCARDNIAVAHPSTPANYFHLLREQARSGDRPLFILTPKMLLRLAQARSPLAAFADGAGFEPVIASMPSGPVRRAVLCSGKIAYEAEKVRAESDAAVAIVRIETLYPFPAEALAASLAATGVSEMLWLQEEPENYGAGAWLATRLAAVAGGVGAALMPMVARPESASPAGGFHMWHDRDQRALILRALGVADDEA